MKKSNLLAAMLPLIFLMPLIVTAQKTTNSFFDNDETIELKVLEITVSGEVLNPGTVNFSELPLRSVIVKEAIPGANNEPSFVGAYRYDGYSLVDILNVFPVRKINAEEFPPLVDVYVLIENDKGQKVVLSWGELFYSNNPHSVIIATKVMRIVPEKTKEQWPLPSEFKLVVSHDLLTVRNISNPTKITVLTYQKDLNIEKGKFPMSADQLQLSIQDEEIEIFQNLPEHSPLTLHAIFYGKGRGLHSMDPFTGCNLKEFLAPYCTLNSKNLMNGLVLFGADDGYRAVFTLSELCNRNDQQYTLLLLNENDEGEGRFRIYPSADFFSDRSVKGLTNIWFYLYDTIEK
jgi:hypothetical protein